MSGNSVVTQPKPQSVPVISDALKTTQVTAPSQLIYVRAAVAPNGRPWPDKSGYVSGYKILSAGGLSTITVDNTRNDSDVFVKLVDHETNESTPVRQFFIKAHEQFKISSIRAGRYDIRYRNLDSGVISKTAGFQLNETQVEGGTTYDTIRITLYKILGGNMNIQEISEEEFGDLKSRPQE